MEDKTNQNLQAEVKDLLNQIAILLKDTKSFDSNYNDDGYGENPFNGIYNRETDEEVYPNKEQAAGYYLGCVKNYVASALKDDGSSLVEYENKYHSSACW